MRILKLPVKILYYVSDEFNKVFKNVFLCVSIQIAARISTGKSDMAIAHCWICILIPNPDFPHFYYMLGGNLGSILYSTSDPK